MPPRRGIKAALDQAVQPAEEKPAGWRGLTKAGVEPKEPKRRITRGTERGRKVLKTLRLNPETVERLIERSEQEGVAFNELADYLLTYALDQLDRGAHQLPTVVEVKEERRIVR